MVVMQGWKSTGTNGKALQTKAATPARTALSALPVVLECSESPPFSSVSKE